MTNGQFNDFEDICRTHELDRGDFFWCLQIRNFFAMEIKSHDSSGPSKIIEEFIDAYNSEHQRHRG